MKRQMHAHMHARTHTHTHTHETWSGKELRDHSKPLRLTKTWRVPRGMLGFVRHVSTCKPNTNSTHQELHTRRSGRGRAGTNAHARTRTRTQTHRGARTERAPSVENMPATSSEPMRHANTVP